MSRYQLQLVLAGCFACGAGPVLAQMPSVNFEPVNQLGRMLGIGFSDGYHECKGERFGQLHGNQVQFSAKGTQLYETATFPPAGHHSLRHSHGSGSYSSSSCPTGIGAGQPLYAAPVVVPQALPQSIQSSPSPLVPQPQVQPRDQHSLIPQPIPNLDDIPQAPPAQLQIESPDEGLLIPDSRADSPSDVRQNEQSANPVQRETIQLHQQEKMNAVLRTTRCCCLSEDDLLIPDQVRSRRSGYDGTKMRLGNNPYPSIAMFASEFRGACHREAAARVFHSHRACTVVLTLSSD